ncbi:MAG: hypothetical protein ACE5HI_02425 [bacterium]
MPEEKYKAVNVLKEYYEEIEKIIAQSSQFKTVSEYINYVLKELLFSQSDSEFSKDEEAIIKKRMQDLGYM